LSTSWKIADGHLRGHLLVCRWRKVQRFMNEHNQQSSVFTARLYRFYVKLTMPVAKLAWDAQEPKDQAVLARQLPVQELIPRLATKGLRQAPGGLVQ
jgi:hypothetical protein